MFKLLIQMITQLVVIISVITFLVKETLNREKISQLNDHIRNQSEVFKIKKISIR